jgi:hypothetical protein
VTPTRVVWQAGENTFINAEALLSKGNGQVTLDETNVCMMNEDGALLLDFGRELQGGIQINIGRSMATAPTIGCTRPKFAFISNSKRVAAARFPATQS